MNIPDIEAFVALAETGSVNRAALRLNLTQPAVTRRIQSFEAAMGGAVLLDRRSKPSTLTPEGRRVLESCRQVLKAMAELKLNALGGPLSGEIRLGIAHGLAERALDGPIDALRQRFPSIRPRVISHWTTWLIEQVRNGTLDCAVGLVADDSTVPSSIHSTAIGIERIVVVAASEAVISSPKRCLSLRDLAGSDWILNPQGCGYRDAIQRAFDQTSIPLRIVAEVFGHDLQLSLVSRGAGLGLVPRRHINNSPYRRRLRVLKLTDFDFQVAIAMLHGGTLGRLAPVIEHFQSALRTDAEGNANGASLRS
ncbi:LysR family transcriptional regulator [Mesorhizobium muleiense]|nr:LysR family transcriptional regulator [Mesorhizobium muleiense]